MKQTVKLVSMLALTILLSSPVSAGIGKGSSVSVRLDAVPPEVGIVAAPVGETLSGGDMTYFAWWASDTYPALHDSSRIAAVLAHGQVVNTLEFSSTLDHDWDWLVYEVNSSNSVLEVTVRDEFGNSTTVQSGIFYIDSTVAHTSDAPSTFALAAPAPNPFNPQTTLSFTLSAAGPAALSVYDLQGRLVRRLFSGELAAGTHVRAWDGRGDNGRRVAGGPYLVRLDAGGGSALTRKVVLLP